MCQRLADLAEALGRFASGFDAAVCSGADAAQVVKAAGSIENIAATLKASAAARVADTGGWRSAGDRSPAHHLARTSGTSVAVAAQALETARRLESLPDVAAAARSGMLSVAQTAAIAQAAVAAPAAAGRLIDAGGGPPG